MGWLLKIGPFCFLKMKRGIASLFILVLLVAFMGSLLVQPACSQSRPKIGIFYYLWYNGPDDSSSWANHTKIVDKPLLGYYNSSDPVIIEQHLKWMQELGIDFVILSWWGDNYGNLTDYATREVLNIAQNINSTLKFAVIVEPFNGISNPTYNYSIIYNHVYNDLVLPYSSIYYNYNGKPLVCFFNDPNNNPGLTPNGNIPYIDSRFSTVIVGDQNYVQWVHTDLDKWTNSSIPSNITETSVTPRFDDSRFRSRNCTVDPNLTKRVFDQEWNNAKQLWLDGKIDTIMISSWNEYVERTEIEPHFDATANNTNPYFLYNETKDYITQLANSTPTPTVPEYTYTLALSSLIFTAVTISLVCMRLKRNSFK